MSIGNHSAHAASLIGVRIHTHAAAEPTGLARATRKSTASATFERGELEAGGAFAGIGFDQHTRGITCIRAMAAAREAFSIRVASRSTAIGTVKVGAEFDEVGEEGGLFPDECVDQWIKTGIGRQNDCVSDGVGEWVLLINRCHEAEQKRKGNGGRLRTRERWV